MDNEFIPYEQALDLKELGFDEPCIGFYKGNKHVKAVDQHWGSSISGISKKLEYKIDDLILALTFSQAFRWFREKHNLHSYIEGAYPWFRYYINSNDNRYEGFKHLTFEEAELACLTKLIEIVKDEDRIIK